jgi:MinD-like ATPase involved in chromosome partitioning or flagellar assembly
MAIRSLAMSQETFAAIGYPPSKLTTVLNRSDALGGFSKADVEQALGSRIDFEIVSDGRLVLASNNEGIAFVSSSPESPIAQGVRAIADSLAAHQRARSPAMAGR